MIVCYEENITFLLGVRIDNYGDKTEPSRNIRIDSAYVSGASSHAVETYGVDGITIGTVTARNVGESGLLLNQTVNATVGTVDAENAGAGTPEVSGDAPGTSGGDRDPAGRSVAEAGAVPPQESERP